MFNLVFPSAAKLNGQTSGLAFFYEPGRKAADYIKNKMKAQIEQYNKKKNANNSTPNLSTNISHHSTHTAKHEAKNPNNTHHLVLANSTTQMSSLAVVDCYILRQMGTQLNHVHVLSHLVGRGLLPQQCRLRHCPSPRPRYC